MAAALAWSIGLLPSSIPHIPWSSPVTWLIARSSGRPCCYPSPPPSTCCCEASFTPPGAGSGSTVLAWSLGICWTFAPSPLVNASTPILSLIGIYAMAGLLMATTVAVITGLCWLSWLRSGTIRTVSGVA